MSVAAGIGATLAGLAPRLSSAVLAATAMAQARADEAAHLAGVEQPVGVDLVLEAELVGVDALVPAAVLERVNVRVRDHDPVPLVNVDDLVQPLGRLWSRTSSPNSACISSTDSTRRSAGKSDC